MKVFWRDLTLPGDDDHRPVALTPAPAAGSVQGISLDDLYDSLGMEGERKWEREWESEWESEDNLRSDVIDMSDGSEGCASVLTSPTDKTTKSKVHATLLACLTEVLPAMSCADLSVTLFGLEGMRLDWREDLSETVRAALLSAIVLSVQVSKCRRVAG